jgi:lysophospholipase L1-like esterase
VVLASDVKSLVIIAETLTIGQRVTISWDRPSKPASTVPSKPGPPPGYDQATGPGSARGRDGYAGYVGGPGESGDPAPEIELWFLQSNGFPAIDLRGQDGFIGVRGGDGGDGGRGQMGCNSKLKANGFGGCEQRPGAGGHGGNGGRAGDGGPGGNGGTGGEFAVFAPQAMINTWLQEGLTISVDGGNGGAGGDSGRPGEGGPGGDKGNQGHPAACSPNNNPAGQKGNTGASGVRGADGKKGSLQPNSIQYSAITASDFFIELTKPAIVSVGPTAAFVGDTVSVNGLRFSDGDRVFIEGYDGTINVPCVTTFISQSLLTFIVPRVSGGYASLEVVQSDGTRSTSKGTLNIRPRIEGIMPTSRLKPGQFYFLRGTGLGRSGNIWINGEGIGTFTAVDNDTIKFKARRPSTAESNPEGERVKLKVVNAEGAGAGNPHHSSEIDVVLDTYRMLVCGDSVMWGGGLPEHLKYYSLAADYITAKMENVSVHPTIKAHHGAKIGRSNTTVKDEMHGEISSRWPTILQQVVSLNAMPDASEVDLVIINGGANDLPITAVMLESDSNQLETVKADLRRNTRQYCFDDMIFMLQKVVSQFPKAKVIVTGYYHIVSEESSQNFIQRMILTIWEDLSSFPLGGNTMAETRAKTVALANVWVLESNRNLAEAVQSINNSMPDEPRVFFVDPETTPSNAAHAPSSLLWEPDMLGGPSDPMWKGGRQALRDTNEDRIRSEGGAMQYYIIKGNSSYHPNPAGAQRYFEKMKPVLDLAAKVTRVAIRSNTGRYLCAEGGGNGALSADRVSIGAWETFEMIDLGNSQIALKSVNGFYICAENGGGASVSVNRWRIGVWETFTLVAHSSGTAFKTLSGNYLTASGGSIISANATQILTGEIFQII